jgi:cleavage stimulation factor subunit 3
MNTGTVMLFFSWFRMVFKKAREDARSNFHVYVAAALMEYYCSKVRKLQ